MNVRVKICCISTAAELALAVTHGASAVGFVSAMPSGAGVVGEETIADIVPRVPSGVASFLLTSRQSVAGIVEQQRRLRATTIQICDHLVEGTHRDLRRALPGIALVQVVHVTGEESVAEAVQVSTQVDAILLDSGNQKLAVKELGGTGRVHDWGISRRIRECVHVPVYLAGGLRADNVAEAIRIVEPLAVDVCTGVRTEGRLDESKLEAFFREVRAASRRKNYWKNAMRSSQRGDS